MDPIVALLIQERDKFNNVIKVLSLEKKPRGRPPKSLVASILTSVPARKRKPMSAETRKKVAASQRKRWAARRGRGKTTRNNPGHQVGGRGCKLEGSIWGQSSRFASFAASVSSGLSLLVLA